MTTPTNWPNPERPGVPMFPERDGAHAIQVPDLEGSEIVYYWHQNGGGWTEYSYQDAEDFLTDEDIKGWIYKGPILTPAQINEMLAAERERCAEIARRNMNDAADRMQADAGEAWVRAYAQRDMANEIEVEIRNLGAAP